MADVHVICFGNPFHGDDGFGVHVYRRLMALADRPSHVACFEVGTAGHAALALLEGCKKAILVDALAGEAPGVVRRLEIGGLAPPTELSLHAMGVEHLAACAAVLFEGGPGPSLVLLGAEIGWAPKCFDDRLSPPVAAAVEATVKWVQDEWSAG
jgi:hydrogenase maturation protease